MIPGATPDLKRALRPVPGYERAVREVSRMLAEAGIRHALVGALAATAYRSRPPCPTAPNALERLFGNVDRTP